MSRWLLPFRNSWYYSLVHCVQAHSPSKDLKEALMVYLHFIYLNFYNDCFSAIWDLCWSICSHWPLIQVWDTVLSSASDSRSPSISSPAHTSPEPFLLAAEQPPVGRIKGKSGCNPVAMPERDLSELTWPRLGSHGPARSLGASASAIVYTQVSR